MQGQLFGNTANPQDPGKQSARSPLIGKLFDEAGEPLTPTHAVKKGRRYRYYVSRALIRNSGEPNQGWRLPAEEVEEAISLAMQNDAHWRLAKLADGAATSDLLDKVDRVSILSDRLLITYAGSDGRPCRIEAPLTMARRGVETKFVLAGIDAAATDPTLARRIVRAMRWIDQLKTGLPISQIAEAEGITTEFVFQNINAGLLSPAILNAVAASRQPPHLTAKMLTLIRLPDLWSEQLGALQFSP